MSVELIVVDTEVFGSAAADAVLASLPPDGQHLGVATGATPLPAYAELAARVGRGDIDLSGAWLVALDEYLGLGGDHPGSYATFVRTRIAQPLGIAEHHVLVPDGLTGDPESEASSYAQRIDALGGVDVQIAGIGSNGHLGFNEPGSAFDSPTRVVTLSAQTRRDNARFFGGCAQEVPAQAITQGLQTIRRARAIVLMATGSAKAAALRAALAGPVTTAVPASILQMHQRVTVVADRAAAAAL